MATATITTATAATTSTTALQMRWGILGCSNIASDFCIAMKMCGGHRVVAVGSKDCERAAKFAEKFGIDRFYGSYEEVLGDAGVDVVYVGTNTSEHYRLAMKVLQANKVLLCEKPLCMSLRQCQSLARVSKKHRKLAVEGLWSRFIPSYDRLRRALVDGEVGEVKEVSVAFCMKFGKDSQIKMKHLGGGVTLGIGCYALHLVTMVFEDSPVKVEAKAELDEKGLDAKTEIVLEFEGGRRAEIKLSTLDDDLPKDAVIKGSKGEIRMKDFWCCEEIMVAGVMYKYPFPQPPIPTKYPNTVGFMHEIERVGEAWRRGLEGVGEVGFETSGRVFELIDKVLEQINVKYDAALLEVVDE